MILILRGKILAIVALILTWPGESLARDVYVRLANSGSYSIGITQGMLTMTDAEGRLANIGDEAQISVSGGYAVIMGNSFLMPVRISGAGLLQFKGRTYRGAFLITQKGGLLNVVDVEQYLCGVLPAEVGANWHSEALRTQAICARTYVLKQSMNRADKGYDVVDTDADQVYKGAGVETAKTNQRWRARRARFSLTGKILRSHTSTQTAEDTRRILRTFGGRSCRISRESLKSSTTSPPSQCGTRKYQPRKFRVPSRK